LIHSKQKENARRT